MVTTKKIESVSIIVPLYNEKDTILAVITKIRKAEIGHMKKEIIIIDDGSTDGSQEILKKIDSAKVFFHNQNRGKGAAIRTGLQHAKGDIVIIQDADLEYNPNDYTKLLEPICKGVASVVYGNRFSSGRIFDKNMYYSHSIGNMILTGMTNILYQTNINDMETGYKVMKKEVLDRIDLKAERFDIEPEITAKILKNGFKIHDVPIEFRPRAFHEGKKINWKDGIIAAWALVKYKFSN